VVIATAMPWPTVDPLIVGVPLAFILTIAVSLLTKAPDKKFLEETFKEV
jgi:solute:Na+ symporter, SSS family